VFVKVKLWKLSMDSVCNLDVATTSTSTRSVEQRENSPSPVKRISDANLSVIYVWTDV